MLRSFLAASAIGILATGFAPATEPKFAPPKLDGLWLFDSARTGKSNDLMRVWESIVTVSGDRFALTKLMGHDKDLKGRLAFDPVDPRSVDLVLEELDFASLGVPLKIPAGTYRGIFKLEGDRMTICIAHEIGEKRPAAFEASRTVFLVTLTRAPAGFKAFPKEITVRVTGPDGKPASNATVARFMDMRTDPKKKDAPAEWQLSGGAKTGPDGTVKAKFEEPPAVVRDEKAKLIAYPVSSPAQLAAGELRVTLAPECRVSGRIVSDEFTKGGGQIGWTNAYLNRDGRAVAGCDSRVGKFEFLVPPGDYTINAYGEELHRREVAFTVPEGKAEFTVAPIALRASALAILKGKPAPELEGVVAWAGKPIKFADLKGQYVLVDFWGYWCGPCVGAMPVLIELHEKFAGKGLAIVGVHVDADGEVDSAGKLAEKVAGYVKGSWNGKELPFANALASGKMVGEDDDRGRGGPPKQYGVLGYPTTILIDPDGKVVGRFHARDIKSATAEIEKLLAGKK